MYGRAVTLDRLTPDEKNSLRKHMFKRWEYEFEKHCNRQLVELFVDEGSSGGVGVILYDGKEYWCPFYDDSEPHLHQWIAKTGSNYDTYDQLTKEFYEIENHELDVLEWLEMALDNIDAATSEEYWGNHGTTVPLIT